MKACINPGSVFAFALVHPDIFGTPQTRRGALVKPAYLKRNTKQGGVIDGIEFSNPANGTVTRKESRIHCLASYGDGIRSGVPGGRRIRKNWLNVGKM